MEDFQSARDKALQNIRIADHMLGVTYPLLKDNKILLAAIENIFLSLTNGMAAILYYDRYYKRVPPFPDAFEVKFNVFKTQCVARYTMDRTVPQLILEVRDILLQHRKSPVEFSRRDSFIICSDDYHIKAITHKEVRDYLVRAKVFIQTMVRVLEENEGVSGGSGT